MLTGLALKYYYSNTSISTAITFDKVCDLIGIYFKGTEYRTSVLSKLNMIILKFIIEKNEGKLIKECLQLLIKNFHHLQYRLDTELRTDKYIHNIFISIGQDILACQYACFKSTDNPARLINNLHSSIITF